MAGKRKTAVFETVALGGYGGSKARMIDIGKGERRIQLQAPNRIGRGRNGPSGGDQKRFLPLQLDYEQEQLGNQPDDESDIRNDGIHWVDVIIGTTISQRRSRLSERQKLTQNWREVEKILSEAIYRRSERACECIRQDVVNVGHITMES
jgi:Na+-translocating ferredoxin:NAD+ oxidoreductase RnfG subunit